MNQFLRHKTSDEIIAQCNAQGVAIDVSRYAAGSDHIAVTLPGPDGEVTQVLYNTFNGRFFSDKFSSDMELDGIAWFDNLLDFFYVQ